MWECCPPVWVLQPICWKLLSQTHMYIRIIIIIVIQKWLLVQNEIPIHVSCLVTSTCTMHPLLRNTINLETAGYILYLYLSMYTAIATCTCTVLPTSIYTGAYEPPKAARSVQLCRTAFAFKRI